MSVRNKCILYGLVGFFSIILVCILVYLIRGDTFRLTYTTELKVENGGSVSEVRISSKDMCKYYFKDGVLIKRMTSIPKAYATPIMELPKPTESFDIENKQEQISDMTWVSDLQNSSNYLDYLKLSGYDVVLAIYRPDNIELFLEKGSVRKRVVIFNNSIMIGEILKDYGLPNVDKYFE